MRELPPALTAHLTAGVTTLCQCWRLQRRDGVTLGFTDHDRDVTFDGDTFSAAEGLDGSAFETSLGFATGGGEARGILKSNALTEGDLASGLYDGARVEIWRVNWADVTQRVLQDAGVVGEVRRTAHEFTAELRSIAHELNQERGRQYQGHCNADLGDARCGVVLDSANFASVAAVTGGDGRIEFHLDLQGRGDGFFDGGRMLVLDGPHAGLALAIDSFRVSGSGSRARLWTRLPFALPNGTQVKLTAGCDKTFVACRAKFQNQDRFRGFPHIPGNDALLAHVSSANARMDGGSLFR